MSTPPAPREMEEPRWLIDEMLGRLSRYLRFLGYDTEYVRGVSDDAIVARAREEGRRLITRDRTLSRRVPRAVLLSRTDIAGQMRELRAAYPNLRFEVRFDRCSLCNGHLLAGSKVPSEESVLERLPPEVRQGRTPLYTCQTCGHLYWEGSHTRNVRRRLVEWNRPTSGGG
jgi:uncharacterized protein